MVIERWASLSVRDHVDIAGVIANVLLYDRLVLPVMTEQLDRDEEAYWSEQGWHPDLQETRIGQLRDLAIRKPWNRERRERYQTRLEELRAQRTGNIDYYGITREILANKNEVREELLPADVSDATIVAAYNSKASLRGDFAIGKKSENLASQAYLLGRRLALPAVATEGRGQELLQRAVDLSLSDDFRRKRQRLFEWQEIVAAAREMSAETAAREIALMNDDYNRAVEKALGRVRWKYAFTFAGAAVSLAGIGASIAIPVIGVGLALVQFVFLDGKPAVDAGSAEPVAMFHDIESELGLNL